MKQSHNDRYDKHMSSPLHPSRVAGLDSNTYGQVAFATSPTATLRASSTRVIARFSAVFPTTVTADDYVIVCVQRGASLVTLGVLSIYSPNLVLTQDNCGPIIREPIVVQANDVGGVVTYQATDYEFEGG